MDKALKTHLHNRWNFIFSFYLGVEVECCSLPICAFRCPWPDPFILRYKPRHDGCVRGKPPYQGRDVVRCIESVVKFDKDTQGAYTSTSNFQGDVLTAVIRQNFEIPGFEKRKRTDRSGNHAVRTYRAWSAFAWTFWQTARALPSPSFLPDSAPLVSIWHDEELSALAETNATKRNFIGASPSSTLLSCPTKTVQLPLGVAYFSRMVRIPTYTICFSYHNSN